MWRSIEAGTEFLYERNRATLQVGKPQLLGFGFVPALNDTQEEGEQIRDEAFVVGQAISDLKRLSDIMPLLGTDPESLGCWSIALEYANRLLGS